MSLLDKIVDTINSKLLDGPLEEQAFQESAIYGLSYLSIPKGDAPQRPYTYDGDNVVSIDVSDIFEFSIYHRCLNLSFTDAPSYGDGNGMVNMVCDMYAVVYADRYQSGYSQEDLIMKVAAGLNGQLSKTELGNSGLQKVKVSVQRANNNSGQVFQGEYGSEANCPFQLNTVYFAINYKIEITAHSACLVCAEC
jgi:hypothetical protein